jgi:tripartite-type tricarboxylate transporter receptor subunit TctC
MTVPRRKFLHLAGIAIVLPIASRIAAAQNYPSRPVRLIVGVPAGGSPDAVARVIGQWLSDRLGQQFIVDNRPGAGSNLGTEAVVRAAADGYALLLATAGNAINATLYENLKFDFMRDIAPVASISRNPLVMVVNPSVPAKSVPEFIANTKANPGKVNMASSGNGTPQHVPGELFKMMSGLDMVHVPYRGSPPALTDLLGGRVQVMFDVLPTSLEHIKVGRLRPLAVTTATRLAALPDIPPIADFLPGYESSGWAGMAAPRNTPMEIVDKLNTEINAALADPKIKARLADIGVTTFTGSPGDFGRFIANETEKWAKVVKFSGAKID